MINHYPFDHLPFCLYFYCWLLIITVKVNCISQFIHLTSVYNFQGWYFFARFIFLIFFFRPLFSSTIFVDFQNQALILRKILSNRFSLLSWIVFFYLIKFHDILLWTFFCNHPKYNLNIFYVLSQCSTVTLIFSNLFQQSISTFLTFECFILETCITFCIIIWLIAFRFLNYFLSIIFILLAILLNLLLIRFQ